jgi:hypothetical protein
MSEKEFATPFGNIVLARRVYQSREKDADGKNKNFIPLDDSWGMVGQFATIDVRETVLFAVSLITPNQARKIFDLCSHFSISETSMKKIVGEISPWLDTNEDNAIASVREQEELPIDQVVSVVVSEDGANILLNEPGKKKGRKRQRPGERKNETEISFDSPTSYKNATIGSVSLYGVVPLGKQTPSRLQSKYVARMPEEKSVTLKRKLLLEMEHTFACLPDNIVKIYVTDAARGLQKEVDNNPFFCDFEKIVDYFHATEHLSRAAEAIFGKNTTKGVRWYENKKGILLNEITGADNIFRSLEYYVDNYDYGKDRNEVLRTEATFFCNNKHRMEYKRFRDNGWVIGSGVIEAACKSIVKQRFCQSGMRWTRQGGQPILTLRAIINSKRWENFWKYYKLNHIPHFN